MENMEENSEKIGKICKKSGCFCWSRRRKGGGE
jgi:hypothetical protein